MDSLRIVGQLQETILNARRAKEEASELSSQSARYWAVGVTKSEEALAWIQTYCVEDDDES